MENGQWKTENRADALVFAESGGILHYIYGSPERNWEDKLSFSVRWLHWRGSAQKASPWGGAPRSESKSVACQWQAHHNS